jgi:hypothetical protein
MITLNEAIKLLNKYAPLGTPEEIERTIYKAEEIIGEYKSL